MNWDEGAYLEDGSGGIPKEITRAEFDRFIAKVRADALREAANMIGGKCGPRGGVRMADEVEWAEWLSARANEIEEQERQ